MSNTDIEPLSLRMVDNIAKARADGRNALEVHFANINQIEFLFKATPKKGARVAEAYLNRVIETDALGLNKLNLDIEKLKSGGYTLEQVKQFLAENNWYKPEDFDGEAPSPSVGGHILGVMVHGVLLNFCVHAIPSEKYIEFSHKLAESYNAFVEVQMRKKLGFGWKEVVGETEEEAQEKIKQLEWKLFCLMIDAETIYRFVRNHNMFWVLQNSTMEFDPAKLASQS